MVTGTLRHTWPVDELGSLATVTVQAGAAAAGYEATYLTDFSDLNLGRPTLATGTQISLQLAFGSAKIVNGFLIWHNFDDGSTITIKANSSASWGSPPYTTTIVVPTQHGNGRKVKVFVPITNQNYQYWLIVSPTNSVAPGLKAQVYTQVRSLTGFIANANAGKTFQWGVRRPNAMLGIDHPTEFGFHWAYNFNIGAESMSGPIAVSDAGLAQLKGWHEATGGRALTLFVPDSGAAEAFLARISLGPAPYSLSGGPYVSALDVRVVAPDFNVVTLTVEDMTAGGPEWT